jgi:hypothetical protein
MAINDNLENDSLLAAADKQYESINKDYQGSISALPSYEAPAYQAPTEDLQANIKEGSSYVTPQSLVSEQLNKLLSSDSQLMKQAEGDAKRKANSMGLLSSSMAIGAAQGEAMRQATPIAQADAQTYANSMLQQQQAQNQIGQTQAEAVVTGALKEQTAKIDALRDKNLAIIDGFSNMMKTKLGDVATAGSQIRQFNLDMEKFGASVTAEMEKVAMTLDADKQITVLQGAADLVKNNQISMEQLLKDPDFMQLEPEAIRNTLNNLVQQTIGGIRFIGASSSIDMTPFLNTLEADLSWSLA